MRLCTTHLERTTINNREILNRYSVRVFVKKNYSSLEANVRNFSNSLVSGLRACPSQVIRWLRQPRCTSARQSQPRPKGKLLTSILKEKKPFSANISLWLGPEMVCGPMPLPGTSKDEMRSPELSQTLKLLYLNKTELYGRTWQALICRPAPTYWFCAACKLRMVFTFLNGYILNGYISTYIKSSILSLGPQSLKYLLCGLLRTHLLKNDYWMGNRLSAWVITDL